MSDLKCNVTNCINNEHSLCSRSSINVEGCDAQKCCDTFCHSFNHRMPGMQNSLSGHPSATEQTSIKCSARECTYNTDNNCTAKSVEMSGNGACSCSQTDCATFTKR